MDNLKLYMRDVQKVEYSKLEGRRSTYKPLGRKYRLYKNDDPQKKDWYVSVYVKSSENRTAVTILGSIRKWYYGKWSYQDLSPADFKDCIELIAERIGLSVAEIWNARVMSAEVSLTLVLKPSMRYFLYNLVSYKTFKVYRFDSETVGFIGEDKSLKFYNAIRKNLSEREFAKKQIQRIESKHFTIFRVEAKITDLDRVERRMGKIIATPKAMLKNWDEVYAFLRNYIGSVKCFGVSSEDSIHLDGGGRIDLVNYILRAGITYIGIEQCFKLLKLIKSGKPRHESRLFLERLLREGGFAKPDLDNFLAVYDKRVQSRFTHVVNNKEEIYPNMETL